MDTSFTFTFEKLDVYKRSIAFTSLIYKATQLFPDDEKFGLSSQLRRAAVSVSSNIAEGSGRFSSREQARFIEIAYSSLLEVFCQLEIGVELGYLKDEKINNLRKEGIRICKMLQKLRSAYLRAS